MTYLKQYFPELSLQQLRKIREYGTLVEEWNDKVNLVSRKDLDQFELHHIVHSLSILKFVKFKAQSRILDLGTGGGLPGIPLAICLPDCKFILADGKQKKIAAAEVYLRMTEFKGRPVPLELQEVLQVLLKPKP